MPAGDPLNWRAGVFFCGWNQLLSEDRRVGYKEGYSHCPNLKVRVSRPYSSLRSRKFGFGFLQFSPKFTFWTILSLKILILETLLTSENLSA